MHRAEFIRLALGLAAGEAWLSGCGSDAEDGAAGAGGQAAETGGGARAGSPSGGSAGAVISTECAADAMLVQTSSESHDHLPLTAPITAATLNLDMAFELLLPVEQNHRHTLSFTVADLMLLRAGHALTKTSSNDSGHSHTYSITCT